MCRTRKITNQFTKPESNKYGVKIVKSMNRYHQPLHEFARQYLNIPSYKSILDIGCGGGKNIFDMAQQNKEATLYGIDHSEESIRQATELNAIALKDGRIHLEQTNIFNATIIPTQIDLVTAFETIYFWDDIVTNFKTIHDILSPQGVFCIAQECGSLKYAKKLERKVKNLKIYTPADVEEKLKEAGFAKIETNLQGNKREGFTVRAYK